MKTRLYNSHLGENMTWKMLSCHLFLSSPLQQNSWKFPTWYLFLMMSHPHSSTYSSLAPLKSSLPRSQKLPHCQILWAFPNFYLALHSRASYIIGHSLLETLFFISATSYSPTFHQIMSQVTSMQPTDLKKSELLRCSSGYFPSSNLLLHNFIHFHGFK